MNTSDSPSTTMNEICFELEPGCSQADGEGQDQASRGFACASCLAYSRLLAVARAAESTADRSLPADLGARLQRIGSADIDRAHPIPLGSSSEALSPADVASTFDPAAEAARAIRDSALEHSRSRALPAALAQRLRSIPARAEDARAEAEGRSVEGRSRTAGAQRDRLRHGSARRDRTVGPERKITKRHQAERRTRLWQDRQAPRVPSRQPAWLADGRYATAACALLTAFLTLAAGDASALFQETTSVVSTRSVEWKMHSRTATGRLLAQGRSQAAGLWTAGSNKVEGWIEALDFRSDDASQPWTQLQYPDLKAGIQSFERSRKGMAQSSEKKVVEMISRLHRLWPFDPPSNSLELNELATSKPEKPTSSSRDVAKEGKDR